MNITPSLELLNIHKGKRGIIVGSGWSLNDFDLSIFKEDIIFACSRSVLVIDHCTYFCMTDGSDPESNFFEIGCDKADKILFCTKELRSSPGIARMWSKIENKSMFLERRQNADLNFDDSNNLIMGTDIGHVMTHVAYIMGCRPLILVGIDLNYKNNERWCNTKTEVVWSKEQGYGGSYSFSRTSSDSDIYLDNSYNYWLSIKKRNPSLPILITNPQSRLNKLFPVFN